jgi:peptide/nickel transport system permease protein
MIEIREATTLNDLPAQPSAANHWWSRGKGVRIAILRWVIAPLVTVLVASFIIFVALSLAPGDPVTKLLGSHATPSQIASLRQQLGLNLPVPVRYFHWLAGAVQGNFGLSITYRTGVAGLLEGRLITTLFLVVYAGMIVVAIGILLGIVGAVVKPLAPVVAIMNGIGIAIPSYVAAAGLIGIFAVWLAWFPALGAGSGFADRIWHLTLPAIALAIGWSAYVAQITRASLREEQAREHVGTAIGRGVPSSAVFRRHVLRNAAVPIVTISGLTVAGLVAGAVVVEEAFGIDGVGSFLVTSVENKDYNVVEAISVILVLVFVVVTTLLDAIHIALDPRLRDSVARK